MSDTSLSLVTAPTAEPVDLDEVKTHLKVDVVDDDELIVSWIQAAREHVETFTHRALMTQTWDYTLDCVPSDGVIWLPKAPTASITSLSYVDGTGTTQTWASSNYRTDIPAGPWARKARITSAYGVPWPVTRKVTGALTVRFVAGYGTARQVPSAIKAAMRLLIGHWYEQREAVIVGTSVTPVPMAVDSLLWPFKSF